MGGGVIDSYELDIDNGAGGSFTEVVGFTTIYTLNSVIITTNIASGLHYNFRYRVHNAQGWGNYSQNGTILAATVPYAPSMPNTLVIGTNLNLNWMSPSNTGGIAVPILNYLVEI